MLLWFKLINIVFSKVKFYHIPLKFPQIKSSNHQAFVNVSFCMWKYFYFLDPSNIFWDLWRNFPSICAIRSLNRKYRQFSGSHLEVLRFSWFLRKPGLQLLLHSSLSHHCRHHPIRSSLLILCGPVVKLCEWRRLKRAKGRELQFWNSCCCVNESL